MRTLAFLSVLLSSGLVSGCDAGTDLELAQAQTNRAKCESYGFREGTDAFANCMMQMDIRHQAPSRNDRIRTYRNRSQERMGNDRFPVCGAANMDAELDIETGKWVGPDCQMAPG